VLALGPRTPLFRVFHGVVPGFDLGRVSARWLTPAALCLALLAGYGVAAIIEGRIRLRMTATWVALGVGAVVILGLAERVEPLGRRLSAQWLATALGVLLLLYVATSSRVLAAALIAAVVVIELGAMSLNGVTDNSTIASNSAGHQRPTTQYLRAQPGWAISFTDDSSEPSYAVPGLRPNANVVADVRSLDGYDGGVQVTERWMALIATVNPTPTFDLPLRNQLPIPLTAQTATLLNIRFVVVDNIRDADALLQGWGAPVATDEQFSVYANPLWDGEVRLGDQRYNLERHSPERISVRVSGIGGTLDVDAQAHDGWRATIDGRPTPIVSGDDFRLAVQVPSGAHTIEFRYRPGWLMPSLLISLLSIATAIALLYIDRRHHRAGSSTGRNAPARAPAPTSAID
jgi:hypothetical protein